jgi:hypothetical protein
MSSTIPPSTSTDSLQATPSLTESNSVTEEERQRILAGILAEDDDEEEAVADKDASAIRLARKRIESENAFSSSSEEEDETDLGGIYGHPMDTAKAEQPDTVDFTWTVSVDQEEFRTNALNAMSASIDANNVSPSGRRPQPSSFDREEGPSTAFSFESTAEKVAAAAAKMAAIAEEEADNNPQETDDYLAQAENQVLDEILNAEDETKEGSESSVDAATQSSIKNREEIANEPSKSQAKTTRNKPTILNVRPKFDSFAETSTTNPTIMMMMDTSASTTLNTYYKNEEERESMRRAFQQCISAAVLVSLAHKRYERRRLAAMEIEKVVRGLVSTEDYGRVRAVLLLLSDDYVRSTNEDARKGGVVALAACAIGLKKANVGKEVMECRDLILASVVHACQDHSQRVRYYATESLFNVTKVIPSLAVQHFFILFEILRSLYADVDLDVRSGAELLDKKLKEVIVGAINSGSFSADACVPVFARFVYMRNKATRQLTLTWLQEFSEKLIGAPILEFLHLFLGGIFAMVSDPNATIRQLALEFLQVRSGNCGCSFGDSGHFDIFVCA